jgi:hypothetical protein
MSDPATQPEPEEPAVDDAVETIIRSLAGLRSSVDGFAQLQQQIHGRDYSPELTKINDTWEKAREAFIKLKELPALRLTPTDIARQIEVAGQNGRSSDHEAWRSAQQRLDETTRSIGTVVGSARAAEQQNRWLAIGMTAASILAFIAGCMLPPVVDRAAPTDWRWPEKRAAAILERDAWSAGQHLMQTSNPAQWDRLMTAARFYRENEKDLAACARLARKKAVRCEVDVTATQSRNGPTT